MFKKGINSYLNLDEANELIDGVDTTGKWRELTDGERKQYLVLATIHIDSLMLTSRKHKAEQPLQFPRGKSSEVPRAVLMAQALEALTLSDTQAMQRISLREQGVTSIKLGNTSESYSDDSNSSSKQNNELKSKVAMVAYATVYSRFGGDVMSLFTPYFKDSISVQNYIGVNDFGDSQYSSAKDVLCRVEYKTQETLDSKGNKVISTATIYARFLIYRPLS